MHLGFRKIEAIVSTLILTILGIFIYLVVLSKPDIGGIFAGFLPQKEIVGIGLPKGSQALTPVSYTHLDVYKRQVLFGIVLVALLRLLVT